LLKKYFRENRSSIFGKDTNSEVFESVTSQPFSQSVIQNKRTVVSQNKPKRMKAKAKLISLTIKDSKQEGIEWKNDRFVKSPTFFNKRKLSKLYAFNNSSRIFSERNWIKCFIIKKS